MKTQKLILCMALAGVVCICGLSDTSWALTLSQNILPGGYYTVIKSDGTVVFAGEKVSAGYYHTVGLKSNGTVVAVGNNNWGQLDVGMWTDIVQVAAGWDHTVGLKSNGTVVGAGSNIWGELNTTPANGFTDIVQVSAGYSYTVGLKSNGTVVAVGKNNWGQLNVGTWTDIVQVSGGNAHTVGLKSNGTVVAVGWNFWGQLDVGMWTDIVQVAAGYYHTVGLKSIGTVVAVGRNDFGQLNVGSLTDIAQVSGGEYHTVGLKSNGTVVAVGSNFWGQLDVGTWTDIVQVSGAYAHTVGLKSNGTVVAVGTRVYWSTIGNWRLGYTIRGYVTEYNSAGVGTGINGVKLTLTPGSSVIWPWPVFMPVPPILTTDNNGYYERSILANGNYQITIPPYLDYNIMPHNFNTLNLVNPYDVDFGLYTIDGYVRRYGTSEGINGVNVTITGGETAVNRTTADKTLGDPGYYRAYVGHSGSRQYTVTPSNP